MTVQNLTKVGGIFVVSQFYCQSVLDRNRRAINSVLCAIGALNCSKTSKPTQFTIIIVEKARVVFHLTKNTDISHNLVINL